MPEITEAKRWVKLRKWSEMARACMASGQKIRIWCKENGIEKSTYYYRLKCLRQAALDEPEQALIYLANQEAVKPVFTRLDFDIPQIESSNSIRTHESIALAATVRMGVIAIDINNGADPALIAATLRLVHELC